MKTARLIGRIEELLRHSFDELSEKELRKTIKSLRHKQEVLEERLQQTQGKGTRRKLQRQIDLLREQRLRGAETYRCLVALHQNGDAVVHPANGSSVFLADQTTAPEYRVN